jgi:hypothetical protein
MTEYKMKFFIYMYENKTMKSIKSGLSWGLVAHTCNLGYFGRLKSGASWLKASPCKKFARPLSQGEGGSWAEWYTK